MEILSNLILTSTTSSGDGSTTGAMLATFLPMVLVLVFFYFVLMRPQRKEEQKTQKMREQLQIGDEVVTVGGLVGIIVRQTEDTVVIETGGERNKIRVKKWAIKENLTQHEEVEAVATEKKETKKKADKSKED